MATNHDAILSPSGRFPAVVGVSMMHGGRPVTRTVLSNRIWSVSRADEGWRSYLHPSGDRDNPTPWLTAITCTSACYVQGDRGTPTPDGRMS